MKRQQAQTLQVDSKTTQRTRSDKLSEEIEIKVKQFLLEMILVVCAQKRKK